LTWLPHFPRRSSRSFAPVNPFLPNTLEHKAQQTHDLLVRKPQHAIAGALEHPIAPRIGSAPLDVIPAIHLNNELHSRSTEIGDEAAEKRHLPAEDNAEPPSADTRPEQGF